MESLYPLFLFLVRNDVWIYIVCGLGLFWYAGELLRANRRLQGAMYGLERESGQATRNNALFFIIVFTLIVGGVAYVNLEVAPTLPPEILRPPTPTPNPFRTPLASPTPPPPIATRPLATPPLAPTITLRGDLNPEILATRAPGPTAAAGDVTPDETEVAETSTPLPLPPPVAAGCEPNVTISQPSHLSRVFGEVSFFGTAQDNAFSFYKLEINGPQTNSVWASLLGTEVGQPVQNGFLGRANLSQWSNGTYQIRLIVVDATSNETGRCTISVSLVNG